MPFVHGAPGSSTSLPPSSLHAAVAKRRPRWEGSKLRLKKCRIGTRCKFSRGAARQWGGIENEHATTARYGVRISSLHGDGHRWGPERGRILEPTGGSKDTGPVGG